MQDFEPTISNAKITRSAASSSIVLACEHASFFIPEEFGNLGLSEQARCSHAAWDPGASAVAAKMSSLLETVLVEATVSRLVYDCNRPTNATDAMPDRSEAFEIPGNRGLSEAERARRAALYYAPFEAALASSIARRNAPVLMTIHSFTPVYNGIPRDVEIGILHDSDPKLANAFLKTAPQHCDANVQRNEPYGPEHGVTHTLKTHAIPNGHLNVMIEIRNDLIQTEQQQTAMAAMMAAWTRSALADLGIRPEGSECLV